MRNRETTLLLLAAAQSDQGIYPACTVQGDGTRQERTPWQDGWNAACMDLTQRWVNFGNWFDALDDLQKETIHSLLEQQAIDLSVDEDRNVALVLVLNDTFARACADSEEVPMSDLATLAGVWKDFGHDGLTAYAATKRNQEPLPELQTPLYVQARQKMLKIA
jgi:hypothetical protein